MKQSKVRSAAADRLQAKDKRRRVKPAKGSSPAGPVDVFDTTLAFEEALAVEKPPVHYVLRLFITGTTPRCARAIRNIRLICEENFPGLYELEVVDIYQNPGLAGPNQIVVTPTLVRTRPLPSRRMIGDLSDSARVLAGLDITERALPCAPPGNEHGV